MRSKIRTITITKTNGNFSVRFHTVILLLGFCFQNIVFAVVTAQLAQIIFNMLKRKYFTVEEVLEQIWDDEPSEEVQSIGCISVY